MFSKSFQSDMNCSRTFFSSAQVWGGITGIVSWNRSWPLQTTILQQMKETENRVAMGKKSSKLPS